VYEHYESTERVFADRIEYLDWMEDAVLLGGTFF
jgi:hypothetical protein